MHRIILTNHLEEELKEQIASCEVGFYRVFANKKLEDNKEEFKEFSVEDAHAVIQEAYISSHKEKTLILCANIYNLFAQNALLKILEESPKNINFILIGRNKNIFLSTVRSRLLIEDKRMKQKIPDFDLDLTQLNLKAIYDFLHQTHDNSFEYTKQKIQSLLFSVEKSGINLSSRELSSFDNAILSSFNYQRFHYVLLPLLLMILEKKKKNHAIAIFK